MIVPEGQRLIPSQDPQAPLVVPGRRQQDPPPWVKRMDTARDRLRRGGTQEDINRDLMRVFMATHKVNPMVAGEAQRKGIDLNIDTRMAEENIEKVRELWERRQLNLLQLGGNNPVTVRALLDPEFARVARGDLSNMTFTEGWVNSWNAQALENEKSLIGHRQARGLATEEDRDRLDEISLALLDLPRDSSGVGPIFGSLYGTSRVISGMWETALISFGVGLGAAGTAAAFTAVVPPAAAISAKGAFAFGSLSTLATMSSRLEAGNYYLNLREMGVTHEIASTDAQIFGAISGLLEAGGFGLGAGLVLKKAAASFMARRQVRRIGERELTTLTGRQIATNVLWGYGVSAGSEIATENLQEMSQYFAEEVAIALTDDKGTLDLRREPLLNRLGAITAETLRGVSILSLFGPMVQARSDFVMAKNARITFDRLTQLDEVVSESLVRERSNEHFANFLEQALKEEDADGNPVTRTVHFSVQTFLAEMKAAGLTRTELRKRAPKVAEALDRAEAEMKQAGLETGEFEIPMSEFGARFLAEKFGRSMIKHARLKPGEVSLLESEIILARAEEFTERAEALLDEGEGLADTFKEEVKAAESRMYENLVATGQRPKHARAQAKAYSNIVAVMSDMEGISPAEWEAKHALRYGREGLELVDREEFLDAALDFEQPADLEFNEADHRPEVVSWAREQFGDRVAPNGRAAAENFVAWFGDSQVVDEKGAPLVVYHMAKGKFEAFGDEGKTELSSFGHHFGTLEQAKARGEQGDFLSDMRGEAGTLMELHLRVLNPLRVPHMASFAPDHLAEEMMGLEILDEATYEALQEEANFDDVELGSRLVELLKEAGYDGLVYTNEREGGGGLLATRLGIAGDFGDTYVPFDPTQIKSTENLGDFAPEQPGILEQPGDQAQPAPTPEEAATAEEIAAETRKWLRWEPESTKDGKIKGAPEWVGSRQDFNRMRKLIRKLIQEGEVGRYWYEVSATEVLRVTRNNIADAEKLIQLIAIYSPNADVPGNTIAAIKAYTHWKTGGRAEDLDVGMGALDRKAVGVLYQGVKWEGRKTNTFYLNLMHHLMQTRKEEVEALGLEGEILDQLKQPVTVDLWVYRAFGFVRETGGYDKGSGKYSFAENHLRRFAAELNDKLAPGEKPWTAHQVQAALWTGTRARFSMPDVKARTNARSIAEGLTRTEVDARGHRKLVYPQTIEEKDRHGAIWREEAVTSRRAPTTADATDFANRTARSFEDELQRSAQTITWEVVPSAAIGAPINNASSDVQQQFTGEGAALIRDEAGRDLLAAQLGIGLEFSTFGFGTYEGAITPNVLSHLLPRRWRGVKGFSVEEVRLYAKAIQYIYRQAAVPWFRPENKALSKTEGEAQKFRVVKVTKKRQWSVKEGAEVFEIVKESTVEIIGSGPEILAEDSRQADADTQAAARNKKLTEKQRKPDKDTEVSYEVRGGPHAKAVVLTFEGVLDESKLATIMQALQRHLPGQDFTRTADNEITVINFRDDTTKVPFARTDEEFADGIKALGLADADTIGLADLGWLWTEGEYGGQHNWQEDSTGSSLEKAFSGRPDLLAWLRDRHKAFGALLAGYDQQGITTAAATLKEQREQREQRELAEQPFQAQPLLEEEPTAAPAELFSALARGLDWHETNAATASGWKQVLTSLLKDGKVKKNEIFWSGIEEWLDLQEGKITKEQVMKYLQEEGVKVEITTLAEVPREVVTDEQRARMTRMEAKTALIEHLQGAETPLREEFDQLMKGSLLASTFAAKLPLILRAFNEGGIPAAVEALENVATRTVSSAELAEHMSELEAFYTEQLADEETQALLASLEEAQQVHEDARERLKGFREPAYGPETDESLTLPEVDTFGDLNYREVLIQLPRRGFEDFTGAHWTEDPNVVLHLRLTDRIDPVTGKRTLFLEEIQSDWAQRGRKKGFKPSPEQEEELEGLVSQMETLELRIEELELEKSELTPSRELGDLNQQIIDLQAERDELAARFDELGGVRKADIFLGKAEDKPPRAPFVMGEQTAEMRVVKEEQERVDPKTGKLSTRNVPVAYEVYFGTDKKGDPVLHKTFEDKASAREEVARLDAQKKPFADTKSWVTLGLKQLMLIAINEGYDQIAFVTGEQSAARYDLSNKVHNIEVEEQQAGTPNEFREVTLKLVDGNDLIFQVMPDGTMRFTTNEFKEHEGKHVEEVVGEDIAQKILAVEDSATLEGVDLRVGGEGMIAFYNKIVLQAMEKLARKIGGGRLRTVDYNPQEKDADAKDARETWDVYEENRRIAEGYKRETIGGLDVVVGPDRGVFIGLTPDGDPVVKHIWNREEAHEAGLAEWTPREGEMFVGRSPTGIDYVARTTSRRVRREPGQPRHAERHAAYLQRLDQMWAEFEKKSPAELIRAERDHLDKQWEEVRTLDTDKNLSEQPTLDITEELRESVKAEGGISLFAPEQRGRYYPGEMTALLTENADPSTVMHEMVHHFANVLLQVASTEGAPQAIRDETDKLMRWWKIEGDSAEERLAKWNSMSFKEQAPHQEALTYRYELWTFTAQAPPGLKGLFEKIRKFMLGVYTSLVDAERKLTGSYKATFGVELPGISPEIDQMFTRMMAGEQTVRVAEAARAMSPAFETKEQFLAFNPAYTEEDWKKYRKLAEQWVEDAISDLNAASMRAMGWVKRAEGRVLKEIVEENKKKREPIEKEIREEVESEDIYVVIDLLSESPREGKLSLDAVREMILRGGVLDLAIAMKNLPADARETVMKKLGTHSKGLLSKEGMAPDAAAELLGFDTGEQLVVALAMARPIEEEIQARTEARMEELYGDLNNAERIQDAIEKALHNEARAHFVAAEARFLEGAARPVRIMLEAARESARRILQGRRLNDMSPHKFAQLEARAAREALTAMRPVKPRAAYVDKNGVKHEAIEGRDADPQAAIKAKQRQLLYNQLAKQALEAKEEIRKARDGFKRLNQSDKKLAKTRDVKLVHIARAILAQYGLISPFATERTIDFIELLKEYSPSLFHIYESDLIKAQEAGKEVEFDHRNMTLDEFRAMQEVVDMLWFHSKTQHDIEVAGKREKLEDIVNTLTNVLVARERKDIPGQTGGMGRWHKVKAKLLAAGARLAKVEHYLLSLDGGKQGPFLRYIFNGVKEAINEYRADAVVHTKKLVEMLRELREQGLLPHGEIDAVTELGYVFGKQVGGNGMVELLGAMLHMGNISNKEKLLGGGRGAGPINPETGERETFMWADRTPEGELDFSRWEAFQQKMVDKGILTKEHFDFLQGVWDLMEEIKPKLQEAHMKLHGRPFREVKATSFEITFPEKEGRPAETVTYRGGYVPAAPDYEVIRETGQGRPSTEVTAQQLADEFRHSVAEVPSGFVEERIEGYIERPLSMNLNMIASHIDRALRYAHVQPAVADVQSIMKDKRFQRALARFDPHARENILEPFLDRAVTQTLYVQGGDPAVDAFMKLVRRNTGIAIMFGHVVNALQQLTGISNARAYVRGRNLKHAIAQLHAPGRADLVAMVVTKSKFMDDRLKNQMFGLTEDLRQMLLDPGKFGQLEAWVGRNAYILQAAMQNNTDLCTWVGKFNEVLEDVQSGENFIDLEKRAVIEADSAVRVSQGSFSPEDVAAYEKGTPAARAWLQFTNYFNTAMNSVRYAQKGDRARMYMLCFAIPMIVAEAIAMTLYGEWDDEDDDGHVDTAMRLLLGSQLRGAAATVPVFGPAALGVFDKVSGERPYGDKIAASAAATTMTRALIGLGYTVVRMADDNRDVTAANVRDSITALILVAPGGGVLAPFSRPATYGINWAQGKAQPSGRGIIPGVELPREIGILRGLVTGRTGEAERR